MAASDQFQSTVDEYLVHPFSRRVSSTLLRIVAHWDWALAIITSVIGAAYILYILLITHSGFWDFEAYIDAVQAMKVGMSPYDFLYIVQNINSGTLQFVYPPLVAAFLYGLSGVALTTTGLTVLLTTAAISTLAIPYVLAGCPRNWFSPKTLYVFGFFFVLFGFGGIRLFLSGNIQSLVCGAIVVSIFIAVKRQDYWLFWIVLGISSFIKFYFLAFLLVPLILDRKYVASISFVLIFGALFTRNYFYDPDLFWQFVSLIGRLSREPEIAGFSLYSFAITALRMAFPNDIRVSIIASGLHITFALFVCMLAYSVAQKRTRPERFDLLSCWLFMSAYLISPRLLEYDMAVLVVPLIRLGRMLLLQRGIGIAVAGGIGICGCILLRTPFVQWVGTIVLVGVWVGSAVHWLVADRQLNSFLKDELA